MHIHHLPGGDDLHGLHSADAIDTSVKHSLNHDPASKPNPCHHQQSRRNPALHMPGTDTRWYFAGLNAHKILDTSADPTAPPADLRRFTPLPDLSGRSVDLIFACWSQLVFRAENCLIVRGFRAGVIQHAAQADIVSVIGDHNGIMGALDADGRLYLTETGDDDDDNSPLRLVCLAQNGGPRLAKVSVAGNFKVAVAYKQGRETSDDTITIEEFRDLSHFKAWYRSPTDEAHVPNKRHSVPGRTRQLISNQNIFVLLTEDGAVYTWGDARFRGLGRAIGPARPADGQQGTANGSATGPTASALKDAPADTPSRLHSVADERIVKVSGGGRLFAALASDGNVYVWSGSSLPNSGGVLSMHRGQMQPGELAGVVIEDDETGEPRAFDDVAVGAGHVLLKCPDGKVFAAGDNRNGQLAVDSPDPFFDDWVEVVPAGCSFIRAGSKMSVIRAALPLDDDKGIDGAKLP